MRKGNKSRKSLVLVCSSGHVFDLSDFQTKFYHPYIAPGKKCPMEISYDRMNGSKYCRRKLRIIEFNPKQDMPYSVHTSNMLFNEKKHYQGDNFLQSKKITIDFAKGILSMLGDSSIVLNRYGQQVAWFYFDRHKNGKRFVKGIINKFPYEVSEHDKKEFEL